MPVAAYSVITGGASAGHTIYSESVHILTKPAVRGGARRCAAAHKNLLTVLRFEYLYCCKVEWVAT